MTAHPHILGELLDQWQFHRSFAGAIPLQEAMVTWLENPGLGCEHLERLSASLRGFKQSGMGRQGGVMGLRVYMEPQAIGVTA